MAKSYKAASPAELVRLKRLLRTTPQPHGRLFIHEVHTGEVLLDIEHEAYKAIFAGSPERIIAISSELQDDNTQKGNIALLDPEDGRVLASFDYDSAFYALAASPDRRLIAVGGSDHLIRILDADTLAENYRFRAHDNSISALSFHPTLPITASSSGATKTPPSCRHSSASRGCPGRSRSVQTAESLPPTGGTAPSGSSHSVARVSRQRFSTSEEGRGVCERKVRPRAATWRKSRQIGIAKTRACRHLSRR